MKKSTYETIKTALTAYGYDNAEVLAELDKEINKGAEAKAKTAEAYDALHDIVMSALTSAPATVAEIWQKHPPRLPGRRSRRHHQGQGSVCPDPPVG